MHIFLQHLTMNSLPLLLSFLLLLPIILLLLFKSSRSRRPLPPGPWPLPIVGNLHLLGPLPHRNVRALSKTYGPIFCLRLGSVPTFFVSSPSLARQVLVDNDLSFPGRPLSEAAGALSYGFRGFGFSSYGPYWRATRKLCVSHLFTPARLHSHQHLRKQEMGSLVASLREAAESRCLVDVTAKVDSFIADLVCRMVVGRRCTQELVGGTRFRDHIQEVMKILGSFNISDHLPLPRFFDPQGFRKRVSAVKEPIDKFLEKIVDEHVRERSTKEEREKDLVDILLDYMENKEAELQIDRSNIKAIILDVFEGAMDSPPAAIDWALAELLRNPTVMKKLREELESVVGLHRPVEESDLPKLAYLQMVVKESLRIHPLGAFLVRRAKEDCTIGGFRVPKNSNVMICVWSMFLDPEVWPDPEKFWPERFENSGIDVKGHDFELITFGAGRRICPGMNFGLLIVSLAVAQLVHCFDWELPAGSMLELDMEEKFGLTMPRATHLNATPIYRLSDSSEFSG